MTHSTCLDHAPDVELVVGIEPAQLAYDHIDDIQRLHVEMDEVHKRLDITPQRK